MNLLLKITYSKGDLYSKTCSKHSLIKRFLIYIYLNQRKKIYCIFRDKIQHLYFTNFSLIKHLISAIIQNTIKQRFIQTQVTYLHSIFIFVSLTLTKRLAHIYWEDFFQFDCLVAFIFIQQGDLKSQKCNISFYL